ncbi:MAG: amidohydrolase, partial [Planctomycetaceae bacterium]|nr:amidohydrolase [Planctomycetaceae bacterium]
MLHQPGRRIGPVDVDRVVPFEVLIDRIAADREAAWINCRRTLHANPEPSGQERATTEFIRARLDEIGIACRVPERGVGVIADLCLGEVDEQTRTIAVRADIDALRMQDRKSVDYCSAAAGLAHSCGHDAHTTVVLATAELLKTVFSGEAAEKVPPLRIRFVFQPAEETCEGALWMIEDGALNDVSAIIGLHVDPLIHAGSIGIRYGVLTAQVDELLISIQGKGGHAARPQHTTDPIAAGALLISNLYQVVPRNVDSLIPTVMTIGTIQGGTASNIIPDEVQITGTLRTTDADTRLRVLSLIRSCCQSAAAMSGSQVNVEFRSPLGSVINDVTVTSAFEAATVQVLGDSHVVRIDRPSMGGEDFAMYIDHVRGAQIRLGCAGAGDEWPLLHSPVFDIEESCIAIGARVMARTALIG